MAHQLIDSWNYMQYNVQATLVEAVEQLVVNSDVKGIAIKVLKDSINKLAAQIESTKIHAMILVENKLFCLYSR